MPHTTPGLRFRARVDGSGRVDATPPRTLDVGGGGHAEDLAPQRSPAGASPSSFDGAHALDALVRAAYYNHVSSQILVSSLPPWVRRLSRLARWLTGQDLWLYLSLPPSPARPAAQMFLLFTLREGYVKLWALSRFETWVVVTCFGALGIAILLAGTFRLSGRLLRRRAGLEARAFRAVVAAEWFSYVFCTLPLCLEFVLSRPGLNCPVRVQPPPPSTHVSPEPAS